MECPDYASESIMQWAAEFHHAAGYNFAPKAKTQNANIAKFYNMIDGSHLMLPSHCLYSPLSLWSLPWSINGGSRVWLCDTAANIADWQRTDASIWSHKFWHTMGMMQDPLGHMHVSSTGQAPATRHYDKELSDVIFKPLAGWCSNQCWHKAQCHENHHWTENLH